MNIRFNFIKFAAKVRFIAVIGIISFSPTIFAGWSFIGLGTLGGKDSTAIGINDSGQIVGNSNTTKENVAQSFITGPNGTGMTELISLGDTAFARGINSAGQVTGGYYLKPDGYRESPFHAFTTDANGRNMQDLATKGDNNYVGLAINDFGQIVGRNFDSDGSINTYIMDTQNQSVGLLQTYNGQSIVPGGINNSGQVVGWVNDFSSPIFSVITGINGTDAREIRGLSGNNGVVATSVNDSGQVVGNVAFPNPQGISISHPFVTDSNGNDMIDLGVLKGTVSGFATGINNLGEVIGFSETKSGDIQSFLYSHGGITNLSKLDAIDSSGWNDLKVIDINNHGQIVGSGINADGNSEAFLLSYTPDTVFNPQPINIPAVPEPETYTMLIVGLGFIGWMTRRRRILA